VCVGVCKRWRRGGGNRPHAHRARAATHACPTHASPYKPPPPLPLTIILVEDALALQGRVLLHQQGHVGVDLGKLALELLHLLDRLGLELLGPRLFLVHDVRHPAPLLGRLPLQAGHLSLKARHLMRVLPLQGGMAGLEGGELGLPGEVEGVGLHCQVHDVRDGLWTRSRWRGACVCVCVRACKAMHLYPLHADMTQPNRGTYHVLATTDVDEQAILHSRQLLARHAEEEGLLLAYGEEDEGFPGPAQLVRRQVHVLAGLLHAQHPRIPGGRGLHRLPGRGENWDGNGRRSRSRSRSERGSVG
jgi:hypothetical protein